MITYRILQSSLLILPDNKLTRNKNTRNIFPHHFFPVAIISIICLYMHFCTVYLIRICDQYFQNTYITSGHMTITAQYARTQGFSIQKLGFLHCLVHLLNNNHTQKKVCTHINNIKGSGTCKRYRNSFRPSTF